MLRFDGRGVLCERTRVVWTQFVHSRKLIDWEEHRRRAHNLRGDGLDEHLEATDVVRVHDG